MTRIEFRESFTDEEWKERERARFADQGRRRAKAHRRRHANEIYKLQMREHVVRRLSEGATIQEIAKELGQNVYTIYDYHKQARSKAIERYSAGYWEYPMNIQIHTKVQKATSGEVLDPPEVIRLRKQALQLRKAMLEWDTIALRLGITPSAAQRYAAEALRALDQSEASHAEIERRLMVEQIDDMIRAVRPRAVSTKGEGPVLEAVDRMLKLMDRKSKLLGLDQLPTQDIMVKLQEIATDGGYDMVEIEDIARDVLAKHRFKLPPTIFRPDEVPLVPDDPDDPDESDPPT